MEQKFTDLEYNRPAFEKVIEDFKSMIVEFQGANSYEEQKDIINRINVLRKDFSSSANLVSIRNSINTADEFYKGESCSLIKIPLLFQKWKRSIIALFVNQNLEMN